MIIFDLDGTLADCEHRRHFVEDKREIAQLNELHLLGDKFKPNWQAFYEACDQDKPIEPVIEMFHNLHAQEKKVQIWSGRCESVKEKTIDWLYENVNIKYCTQFCTSFDLKMRPKGDSTPDDELKEMWLLDAVILEGKKIDFVFDDRPKNVRMWRRRGIFVFDVNQIGKEF